ncbi:hypothetical protein H2199_006758 [Coniosporium tulheliwenetii]|uniref:Uncharacterized protein n=1 Tax=Coniosporium tulheliwenetii TaxID=3383036 RepID=A0ACC2YV64_9PEZI|nr:hypothetical protein H2199_006758 [Cladosporium sp. JES 115]
MLMAQNEMSSPSLSPAPSVNVLSLSTEINVATRPHLRLPPQPPTPTPPPNPRILAFLSTLRPPGLARSRRLRKDLDALYDTLLPVDLELAAELSGAPEGRQLHEYCVHMREAVTSRPHLLVAYAWVMYMAVFSGDGVGHGHGDEEEEEEEGEKGLEKAGLSFWHFVGEEDGEDIKREFKRRLEGAETVFTAKERRQVVEEAVEIFRRSLLLVEELDGLLSTPVEAPAAVDRGPDNAWEAADVVQ